MKKRWRVGTLGLFLATAGVLLGSGTASAQSAAEDLLSIFGEHEANIEVNLSGPLLALLSESVRGEDGDFAELLGGLHKVQVRVFQLGNTPSEPRLRDRVEKVLSKLGKNGWETVVRVRDEEDRVDILVRNDGDAIGGLLAFFMDDENAGFVNIDGRFDPAQLGRLASQWSLGPLEGLDLESVRTPGGDSGESSDDSAEKEVTP